MSVDVSWILDIMEGYAPKRLAMEYDNVGLLLGERERQINKILVALDLTDRVVDEAVQIQADFIITHHPLIFKPIKKITDEYPLGSRIMKLIRNHIGVFAAHTNLDMAFNGTNDVLFRLLELKDKDNLCKPDAEGYALGRIGKLGSPKSLGELAREIRGKLGLNTIRVTGNPNKIVETLGLCTGSASEYKYIALAKEKGCDVYITGDVTYHNAQAASELDIALIDGTHFATEVIMTKELCRFIECLAKEKGLGIEVIDSKVEEPIFFDV